jgi:hypothetical protein
LLVEPAGVPTSLCLCTVLKVCDALSKKREQFGREDQNLLRITAGNFTVIILFAESILTFTPLLHRSGKAALAS